MSNLTCPNFQSISLTFGFDLFLAKSLFYPMQDLIKICFSFALEAFSFIFDSCIPVFLNPCIPASLYSCIPVFLNPCISVSLYPYIPVFLYPCNPVSLYKDWDGSKGRCKVGEGGGGLKNTGGLDQF